MEIKTNPISTRTTNEEVKLIGDAASLYGLTISSFVRMAALKKARQILKQNGGTKKE